MTSFTPASGPLNTLVKIHGTGLAGTTSVTFNGHASGTVTNVSATEVDARVPSGAGSGIIHVVTGGGSASSTTSFTYTGP